MPDPILAGGYLLPVLAGLVARSMRPFDSETSSRRAWLLLGIAWPIGFAASLATLWMEWNRMPGIPAFFQVGQVAVMAYLPLFVFVWLSGFPADRLILRWVTRVVWPAPALTASMIVDALGGEKVRFLESTWPERLWSAGRLIAVTSLEPPQAIRWMADRLREDFGYVKPLEDSLGGPAISPEVLQLRPIPWTPRSKWAVFDSSVAATDSGSVIHGTLRLPYGPVVGFAVMTTAIVVFSLVVLSPLPMIMTAFFAFPYGASRLSSLPQARRTLPSWFDGIP